MVTRRLVLAYVLLGVVVWRSQQVSALWWTNYVTHVTGVDKYFRHICDILIRHKKPSAKQEVLE